MKSRNIKVLLIAGSAIGFAAIAQAQPPANNPSSQQGTMMQQGGMMQGGHMMRGGMMGANMRGMHIMTVTVTALDAKTGLVDVSAGTMALKLHFPPASLDGVKTGDKLSVHLGFNKL